MLRKLLIVIACFLPIALFASDKISPIGKFEGSHGTPSGHCYGWSLRLWKKDNSLIGIFVDRAGQCSDPPSSTIKIDSYNENTGDLKFTTHEKLIFDHQTFVGKIASNAIVGTIGEKKVTMKLEKTDPRIKLNSDYSLSAWCVFWHDRARVKGSQNYCKK